MHNYHGGSIVPTTAFKLLSELRGRSGTRVTQMNLYNPAGNSTIELSADGAETCGVVVANGWRQWLNTNPQSVYVRSATPGVAYVDWTEQ